MPEFFSTWKFHSPLYLKNTEMLVWSTGLRFQAAVLILIAAMAFGSLVLCVRGGEGYLTVLGWAMPPLAAGNLLLLGTTGPLLQDSKEN